MPLRIVVVKCFVVLFYHHYIFRLIRLISQFRGLWSRPWFTWLQSIASTFTRKVMFSPRWVL